MSQSIQIAESGKMSDPGHILANEPVLEELVCLVNDDASDASLSPREREVLTQIAEGLSRKQIANHFGVGLRTIETHRDHIVEKLGIHSTAGLTRLAIAKGYVTLGSRRDVPADGMAVADRQVANFREKIC